MKFKSISYGRDEKGRMEVIMIVQDGNHGGIRIPVTKRDLQAILTTIIYAFGLRIIACSYDE
jgi:hypothetical protein